MDQNLEHRIRERAYEIWTAHGCMDGQAEQHWLAAEREVLETSTAVLVGKLNPKKKPPVRHAFANGQNGRAGRLTPHITSETRGRVQRRSAR
jgi:hypothetical protein